MPQPVLHGHLQIVLRGDAFVFVVPRAPQLRLQHGDVELVVAQRRIGVVEHLLGEHREVVEHLARGGGAAHQRVDRRTVGRTVGDQRNVAGISLDHLQRVGPDGEERIGEVEAVPVVHAQVVAPLVGREARRSDGGQEDSRTGVRRGLLRGSVPAAAARGHAQEGQKRDQNASHRLKYDFTCKYTHFGRQSCNRKPRTPPSGGFAR